MIVSRHLCARWPDQCRGVASEAEWRSVLRLSSAHLVTPLLRWTFHEQGSISELPADVLEFLDAIYRLNLEINLVHEDQLAQLIQALNNIAVQPVLLKGAAALVRGLYPRGTEYRLRKNQIGSSNARQTSQEEQPVSQKSRLLR